MIKSISNKKTEWARGDNWSNNYVQHLNVSKPSRIKIHIQVITKLRHTEYLHVQEENKKVCLHTDSPADKPSTE